MRNIRSLEKGQYTGEIGEIQFFTGITLGTTSYVDFTEESSMHYHQNPHISLLLTGGHIEKRSKTSFKRNPGDVLFCHAGESHQFITEESSRNLNIELDEDFLKEYEISENEIEHALSHNLDTKLQILKMFAECKNKDEDTETSVQMLLLDLIKTSRKEKAASKPQWIDKLLCILQDNWNEALTLKELAFMLQVHPVTLSKYFSKYFSCTLGEYRRKLRISKSIALLKNSSRSITEIAYECGFFDHSHFTRNFKEMTGFSPKKFQQW